MPQFPLSIYPNPIQNDLYARYDEFGTPPSPPSEDHWIQQVTDDFWLQQNNDRWIQLI